MKIIFVINSENFDRVFYAFCMATTAAALNEKVNIFFSNSSIKFLCKKYLKSQQKRVDFFELLDSSIKLNIDFSYCSMIDKSKIDQLDFFEGIKMKRKNLTFLYCNENKDSKIIFI